MILAVVGVVCSIIGSFLVRTKENASQESLLKSLRTGTYTAAILAAVLAAPEKLRTADFAGSLRAGSAAMLAACDAGGKVLVTMADCRLGAADGKFETELGDGAAAFLLGSDDLLATLDATASVAKNAIDQWRAADDVYVRNWDMRYANVQLYVPRVKQAVTDLLKKTGLQPADYS